MMTFSILMGREECFVKDTELNTIHLTSNTIHLTFKKLFYEREKKSIE